MKTYELRNMNLTPLSKKEMIETEGGILGLIILYAFQIGVIAAIAATVAASFERGFDQGYANQ